MVDVNSNYIKWNNAIASHFFNQKMAGREVILYINEPLINTIGGSLDEFILSLKDGFDSINIDEFCQKAYQAYKSWRSFDLEYPPYIAYLACCVLATTRHPDSDRWAPQAYYPRLQELLNRGNIKFNQSNIELLQPLWRDLEKWSNEDKKESLGRFVVRRLGEWYNVGLFRAQTVISDRERQDMVKIFEKAELDPTNPPSVDSLQHTLWVYGGDIFEKRTRNILRGETETQKILLKALVSLALEDLERWDGRSSIIPIETEVKKETVEEVAWQRVFLRICIKFDTINNSVTSYFRFKTNTAFPENLQFSTEGGDKVWSCEEDHEGWSRRVMDFSFQPPANLNASTVNWNNGIELVDKNNLWRAVLKGATTRIFISGKDENLPDYIETNKFQSNMDFFVACYGTDIDVIKNWGVNSCELFEKFNIQNLPQGWVIFHGKNARASCPGIDLLTIPEKGGIKLRLSGIKVDRNTFLKIRPPSIFVENSSGNEQVSINGIKLDNYLSGHTYKLSEYLEANKAIEIEAIDGGWRDSKTIYLIDTKIPSSFSTLVGRNKCGELVSLPASDPNFVGAIGLNISELDKIQYPRTLPIGLSNKTIFIGEHPGEISEWPKEPTPTWDPVWAIIKEKGHKKLKANYCGKYKPITLTSKSIESNENATLVRKWAETLWLNRKKISRPPLGALAKMWENYIEVAKHVK